MPGRHRSSPFTTALTVAVALMTAACGSNLSRQEQLAVNGSVAGDGLTSQAATTPGATAQGPAATVAAGGGTGSATSGAGGGGGGKDGGPGTPGGLLRVGAGVQGVTDAVMKVGLYTADGATGATVINGITGTNAVSAQDLAKINKTMIDHINATGGVAGRKVEVVSHFSDYNQWLTASGRQSEHQRMCSAWTEDTKVFTILGVGMMDDVITDCAARAKVPIVFSAYHPPTAQRRVAAMRDYWYSVDGFVSDTREQALGKFLLRHGFFDPGAKVGLMIEDTPGVREGVERGLKPVLAAAGVDVETEIKYPDILSSPWSNYILQFQGDQVTHVLFSGSLGGEYAAFLTMKAAEDQQYQPKWAVASDNNPSDLYPAGTPERQLANTWGMGWNTMRDIGDSAPPVSANDRTCRELLRKTGQQPASEWGRAVCTVLQFLQAAFAQANEVSAAGLAGGVGRLGDSFASVFTLDGATRFAPGRHEGAVTGRLLRWDAATDRFRYTTPTERLVE